MTITLTPVELAALARRFPDLKFEEAIHEVLKPLVESDSEARLQSLATAYRSLTPDLQLEAANLLKTWAESKTEPSSKS